MPREVFSETMRELRSRFGAVSAETQVIEGQWEHQNEVYSDQLVRLFVDVEDRPENRQFFVAFKEHLKSRFHQMDIWITHHPLGVL
jgi:hypothetical protein